jgi:hypothetical protein
LAWIGNAAAEVDDAQFRALLAAEFAHAQARLG